MYIFRYITTQSTLLILLSILVLTSSQASQGGIHISLIHRDSSLSPLYNPEESPYDRVRHSFVRSKARLSYLIDMADNIDNFQAKNEVDDGEYLVKFSIGTPPVQMFAVMDTASKLVLTRNYNKTMSLTYNNISCNSSKCTLLPKNACDSSNMCTFTNDYSDFSHSNTILGSDIFTFETSNGEVFPLTDVIFGSEHDHTSTYTNYNGIFGLGLHNLSMIMQMSPITEPKFTYCLGNISDPEADNRLVLGNGVFLEGQTTSLKVIEGRYNLVVEGLSIGKRRLLIPPEIFQVSPAGGGVIIDAGTTLTFLAPYAYYQLVGELERELGLTMVLWPDPPYERCYNGKLSDLNNFREVIFHLERGVNVALDVPNLFLQVEDGMFCFAVLPSPTGGASVLGSLFQQSYSVGYDLREMLVSFQRIECELIEKHIP
ncbi:aspartic proteinase CDR1 [Beta vulgaris subsp. vulgaris]|uniref:aspartic proteinase CDR1 n=1 Tax=Beta vulgaris subsp. vulgaris TaxID=3555 RepID=UPI00053F92FF|nr:aspartic proteinase CDR1 [Beta vulgaris subsp. vulgaris]